MRGLWALAGVTAVVLLGLTVALAMRAQAGRPVTVGASPTAPAPASATAPTTPLRQAQDTALRRLAFASDRDGNWEIYVMREDGGEQTRLTNDPLQDITPAWEPGGQRIAFLQVERVTGEGFEELPRSLLIIGADGGVPRRLFETQGAVNSLAWAPDGSRLLVSVIINTRRNEGQLVVVDADSGEAVTLTEKAAHGASWSPDGSQIAYTTFSGEIPYVHVMQSDGSEDSRATNSISGHPAWALEEEETRLAFIVWTGRNSSYVALQRELGQRGMDYLTSATLTSQWKQELQWAPDGEHLLYVGGFNEDGSDADLYLLGMEGDDPINLTEGLDLAVGWTEWSPDGSRIVFTSLEVEPTEDTIIEMIEQVHVLQVATGQIRQLTTGGRNGFAVWEPAR